MQIHDIYVAMGSPEALPLHFAWHRIEEPSAQGVSKTPRHTPWQMNPTAGSEPDGKTPMSRPTEANPEGPHLQEPKVRNCLYTILQIE